ncbi:MAG: MraY family glycosyltransferase [Pontibacterium sp.]
MSLYILLLAVSVLALLLTGVIRRYALAQSLLDMPNARSSHSVPTPRGGGVSVVVSFLLGSLVYTLVAENGMEAWCVGVLGAGVLVAAVGFLDDHGHIAARWRLLAHFSAAGWVLYWLGGVPPLIVFGNEFDLGVMGWVLAMFYLVWLLNLYNFMDGIDGIASIEALTVCLGAVICYLLTREDGLVWVDIGAPVMLPLLLAAAVGGFLFWNFPVAKIFMGDAGSGFIGLVLGALSIQAAWQKPELFWCWLTLLGVFIVDATYTLTYRLIRGDKVYEAHRSHAYQYASRQFDAHLPVTLAVGLINLAWLLPLAILVAMGGLDGMMATIIAYIPMVILAVWFKAGQPERSSVDAV